MVSRAKHILTIFDPNPNIFKRNTGALLLQAPLPSKIWRSSCAVSFPAGHPMLIHHIPPCMKALSAVPWPFIHVATLLKRSSHSHHRFLWVTHGNPGVGWPWRGWACTRKIAVKLTIEQGCTRCYFYPSMSTGKFGYESESDRPFPVMGGLWYCFAHITDDWLITNHYQPVLSITNHVYPLLTIVALFYPH